MICALIIKELKMAETKQPKAENKRPRKRNTTGVKRAKASRAKTLDVENPVVDVPVTELPAVETPVAESAVTEVSAAEVPDAEVNVEAKVPAASEASEEELRKAKELLRAHGYGLIGYRDAGEKVKQTLGTGLDFVKGKWQRMSSWLSAKREEIRAKQEEKKRAAAEKKRLEDEEAARRAEAVKNELRLAELRVEEARLKTAAASTTVQHAEEPAHQPVAEAVVQPVAEKAQGAEVVTPADSDVPKCRACGAELVFGARFCRKCGKPVSASVQSV